MKLSLSQIYDVLVNQYEHCSFEEMEEQIVQDAKLSETERETIKRMLSLWAKSGYVKYMRLPHPKSEEFLEEFVNEHLSQF